MATTPQQPSRGTSRAGRLARRYGACVVLLAAGLWLWADDIRTPPGRYVIRAFGGRRQAHLLRLALPGDASSLVLSGDGKLLFCSTVRPDAAGRLSGHRDALPAQMILSACDTRTGRMLWRTGPVDCVVLWASGDGQVIGTRPWHENGNRVTFWDAGASCPRRRLGFCEGDAWRGVLSFDGQWFAMPAPNPGEGVAIFSTRTCRRTGVLPTQGRLHGPVGISADGRLIAAVAGDGALSHLEVWDARQGQLVHQSTATNAAMPPVFSEDGTVLAVGTRCRRRDPASGAVCMLRYGGRKPVWGFASPDGGLAWAADAGAVELWDTCRGKRLGSWQAPACGLQWFCLGSALVVWGGYGRTVILQRVR